MKKVYKAGNLCFATGSLSKTPFVDNCDKNKMCLFIVQHLKLLIMWCFLSHKVILLNNIGSGTLQIHTFQDTFYFYRNYQQKEFYLMSLLRNRDFLLCKLFSSGSEPIPTVALDQ
jgi:hypothetical protein